MDATVGTVMFRRISTVLAIGLALGCGSSGAGSESDLDVEIGNSSLPAVTASTITTLGGAVEVTGEDGQDGDVEPAAASTTTMPPTSSTAEPEEIQEETGRSTVPTSTTTAPTTTQIPIESEEPSDRPGGLETFQPSA